MLRVWYYELNLVQTVGKSSVSEELETFREVTFNIGKVCGEQVFCPPYWFLSFLSVLL